jgi:hypothetical protein
MPFSTCRSQAGVSYWNSCPSEIIGQSDLPLFRFGQSIAKMDRSGGELKDASGLSD